MADSIPSSVYKYKAATAKDIIALEENKLWTTTLDKLNDPLEFGFYVDESLDTSRIAEFQTSLMRNQVSFSFSTSVTCRRLWNYYTNGMQGMVIEYKTSSIRQAFLKYGIVVIEKDRFRAEKDWSRKIAFCGRVDYSGNKIDLTHLYQNYLQGNFCVEIVGQSPLFTKDDSWQDEKEFRYIVDAHRLQSDFGQENVSLNGIVPKSITVGYRMPKEHLQRIMTYCKQHRVTLFMSMPKFTSPSSKQYERSILYPLTETFEM